MSPNHTVAFVGWNLFQFLYVYPVIKNMPEAIFVLEKRKNFLKSFSPGFLDSIDIPIVFVEQNDMGNLDGLFDILVCQTPFKKIYEIKKTRIVMIQYGYAKEGHNFGPWRSLAEVVLVFGDYAAQKIAPFTNSIIVGNPEYAKWHVPDFHSESLESFNPGGFKRRPVILYAPTWGALSSLDVYLESISTLSDRYDILIKIHHNTEIFELERVLRLKQDAYIKIYGSEKDLLSLMAVSDVLISDYSGAILDAIYCQKPVILLNLDLVNEMGHKIDEYSLEFLERAQLGVQVNEPRDVEDAVVNVLANKKINTEQVIKIRSRLFVDSCDSVMRVIESLREMKTHRYEKKQSQKYIQREMLELYELRNNKIKKNQMRLWFFKQYERVKYIFKIHS